MERALMKDLRRWQASPRRKPLVLKGGRAKDFEMAAQWLIDCGLIARVYRVEKPAIPLKAYLEENAYKLFFLDIGLLGASSELDARTLLEGNRVFIEFKGALTEQYVCQQLLSDSSCEPYSKDIKLTTPNL